MAAEAAGEGLRVVFAYAGAVSLHYWDGARIRLYEGASKRPGDAVFLPAGTATI